MRCASAKATAGWRRSPSVKASTARSPFPLLLPQSRTEALLTERLTELGVAIERNVELVSLAQDASGVTANLRHADGRTEAVRTKYLAGCDGARSSVRQALEIVFEGYTEPQNLPARRRQG